MATTTAKKKAATKKTPAKKPAAKAAPAKAPAKPAAAAPKTKDAPIVVARTGKVAEVDFVAGMTVKDAIEAANFAFDTAEQIRLNSKDVTKKGGTKLSPGDQLLIVGNIRGA